MNIEETLVAWGRWSRSGVLPERPRCAVGRMIISKPDPDDPGDITLTDAERINTAMLSLGKRHPNIHAVLMARYFYCNYDDKSVGRRMGVSKDSVRGWRRQGHMFVEGKIA